MDSEGPVLEGLLQLKEEKAVSGRMNPGGSPRPVPSGTGSISSWVQHEPDHDQVVVLQHQTFTELRSL